MPTKTGPASGVTTHVLLPHLCRISGQPPFQALGSQSGQSSVKHRLAFCSVLFGTTCCSPTSDANLSCRDSAGNGVRHRVSMSCSSGVLICLGTSLLPQGLQEMPVVTSCPHLRLSFPGANYSYNSKSLNLIPVRWFDYMYPHACPANHALEMTNCKLLLPLSVALVRSRVPGE